MPVSERERWIYSQVISGNVPDFLRTFVPISTSRNGHTATYYVAPDYLAIGSDADYFLTPMSPLLAQRLADRLGCTLPTRRMVNQIWTNATVKLDPHPYSPATYDILSVAVFGYSSAYTRSQRDAFTNSQPLGALVSGDKKDVILSTKICTNFANASITKPVVIYGWHYPSGAPIQPLYNGHEETYADYSHGIRLVQMALTVDGSANTVTNVLTTPALAGLLSDESLAEGTSANGEIPKPRYTVPALAPVVMTHPRSRSALPGAVVNLSSFAIGDPPLAYRWQFNGTNLAGATNSTLVVSNLTSATAGSYSVVITNASGAVTSRVAVVRLKTTDFPLVWVDHFETNSAANWDVFWGATNGVPDYSVDWAFDYGNIPYTFNGATALIPPAPNSPDDATRGLKLTVNNNDTNAAIAAVNLYPKNFSAGGNFALKFDLWINYPGNAGGTGTGVAGSTQHTIFGIHHLGTNANWAAPTATASDGLWFAVSGEGGDSQDYRAYVGNPGGPPTDFTGNPAVGGLVGTNNTATFFQTLFPPTRFETAGAPGKNWVEVELRQTNNVIVWLMDGAVVALRTNTAPFTQGKIMLGFMDTFNSIAAPARDAFVLFDNVRVENLAPPIHFDSITRLTNGHVALNLSSALGDAFWLEISTNLTNWQPLVHLAVTNQPLQFTDPTAAANLVRYYRARR